ncbi:hypothetical protein BJD78_gp95 [Arthrobacter phage KellEzio]|uniref:Uncharacterized protein n=1 Tax=Arthrobacter phage KellEzio TaxID=1796995 RepID=A0A140G6I0_9CAUD|nr:hypothetical protein BJD78_gp95 [Arthrobacter phage KellEzio]AMM44265.1 hypothetical protein KELLEZIO_95 [Arthrobacter phage KellEzio]
MILSPDCRDGNYQKCPGDAWDDELDCPAVCQHPLHHPGFTSVEVHFAHLIANAKDDYAQVDHKGPNTMDLMAARAVAADAVRAGQELFEKLNEGEPRGPQA